MTSKDIIDMAQEAGLPLAWISEKGVIQWKQLERFAALVGAAEREQCAKVCESLFDADDDSCNEAEQCAQAIRAKGAV